MSLKIFTARSSIRRKVSTDEKENVDFKMVLIGVNLSSPNQKHNIRSATEVICSFSLNVDQKGLSEKALCKAAIDLRRNKRKHDGC